jgi:hypothetical protein
MTAKPSDKILTGCGGSVSLLVRPRFTLLYFTLLYRQSVDLRAQLVLASICKSTFFLSRSLYTFRTLLSLSRARARRRGTWRRTCPRRTSTAHRLRGGGPGSTWPAASASARASGPSCCPSWSPPSRLPAPTSSNRTHPRTQVPPSPLTDPAFFWQPQVH